MVLPNQLVEARRAVFAGGYLIFLHLLKVKWGGRKREQNAYICVPEEISVLTPVDL
jgi:hypothetical protein